MFVCLKPIVSIISVRDRCFTVTTDLLCSFKVGLIPGVSMMLMSSSVNYFYVCYYGLLSSPVSWRLDGDLVSYQCLLYFLHLPNRHREPCFLLMVLKNLQPAKTLVLDCCVWCLLMCCSGFAAAWEVLHFKCGFRQLLSSACIVHIFMTSTFSSSGISPIKCNP